MRKDRHSAAHLSLRWINSSDRWGDGKENWRNLEASQNRGVYARVWRPWPKKHPKYYSVQYFAFFTFNETAFSLDLGNHEGDWMCVDFGITLDVDRPQTITDAAESARIVEGANVLHAIYHNHGRQLFVRGKALQQVMEGTKPHIWLERQTNESWPNRAGRGRDGWPTDRGFATNENFDYEGGPGGFTGAVIEPVYSFFSGTDQASEHKVVRHHGIDGDQDMIWTTWRTANVPNLGERLEDKGAVLNGSLCGDVGAFILEYPGRWGSYAEEAECPRSPPFQEKQWGRAYAGPWSLASEDPDGTGCVIEERTLPFGNDQRFLVWKEQGSGRRVRLWITQGGGFGN